MDAILSSVRDAMNTTFPLKKVSRKEAKKLQNPWMTKEILKEQRDRDKLKKLWISSGHIPDSLEHNVYKTSRNKVVKMIRIARKDKSLKKCEKAKGDSKKIWKVIKEATDTRPTPNTIPDFIKVQTADGNT